MQDFMVVGVVVVILTIAAIYIYKEKKKGVHCIGCSSGGCCSNQKDRKKCNCNS